jgi:hypothetical protein
VLTRRCSRRAAVRTPRTRSPEPGRRSRDAPGPSPAPPGPDRTGMASSSRSLAPAPSHARSRTGSGRSTTQEASARPPGKQNTETRRIIAGQGRFPLSGAPATLWAVGRLPAATGSGPAACRAPGDDHPHGLGVKPVPGLVPAGPAAAGPGPAVWVQDPDRDPAMVAEDQATAALALAGSALPGPARAGSVKAAAARALVSLA